MASFTKTPCHTLYLLKIHGVTITFIIIYSVNKTLMWHWLWQTLTTWNSDRHDFFGQYKRSVSCQTACAIPLLRTHSLSQSSHFSSPVCPSYFCNRVLTHLKSAFGSSLPGTYSWKREISLFQLCAVHFWDGLNLFHTAWILNNEEGMLWDPSCISFYPPVY